MSEVNSPAEEPQADPMAEALGDLVDGVIQDPVGLAEAEELVPEMEAEEAEPAPAEEEPAAPDPADTVVADYMKDALEGVPEEARDTVGRAVSTTFQKAQSRMGRALRQAQDEKEALEKKLASFEQPTAPVAPSATPEEAMAEMPDPTVDPLGYLGKVTEKKLGPLMEKIERLESEQQHRRQNDQFLQEANALASKYPSMADSNSPEYQAFSAWLTTHPDIRESYAKGSGLTLEHLYTLSNADAADSRAEVKVLKNLQRQQRAATASTSPPQTTKERKMSLEEHLEKAWDADERKSPRD